MVLEILSAPKGFKIVLTGSNHGIWFWAGDSFGISGFTKLEAKTFSSKELAEEEIKGKVIPHIRECKPGWFSRLRA